MVFKYGMLCEGDSDLYTLEIICSRIAENIGHEISLAKEVSTPVSGPITKVNIKTKTRQFLARELDFGTYFADFDKGSIDKTQLIKTNISAVNALWLESSVIGIPSPHLEEWLLYDEDFIKNYLKLNSTRPLPHPKISPKDRLQSIVSQNGPTELTIGEFRRIIATGMNIELVMGKSPSFTRFHKSLVSVLNTLNRIQSKEHEILS